MLHSGYTQGTIVTEVIRRHMPESITPAQEVQLLSDGAKSGLIKALKDPQNLLTPMEKVAYTQYTANRGLAQAKRVR